MAGCLSEDGASWRMQPANSRGHVLIRMPGLPIPDIWSAWPAFLQGLWLHARHGLGRFGNQGDFYPYPTPVIQAAALGSYNFFRKRRCREETDIRLPRRRLRCRRWTAAGMLVAEQQFRHIIGYRDLAHARGRDRASLHPRCPMRH